MAIRSGKDLRANVGGGNEIDLKGYLPLTNDTDALADPENPQDAVTKNWIENHYGVTNYSLTEQFTGHTWVDGRQIFQQTFLAFAASAVGSGVILPIIAQDIDLIDYQVHQVSQEGSIPDIRVGKIHSDSAAPGGYGIAVTRSSYPQNKDVYVTLFYVKN
jgi:hypothetical protein